MHRAAPAHSAIENCPAQSVNSANAETPCPRETNIKRAGPYLWDDGGPEQSAKVPAQEQESKTWPQYQS